MPDERTANRPNEDPANTAISKRSKDHQTTQVTGPGVERRGDTQPRGIAVLMLTMSSNFESRSIGFWPEDIKEFVLRSKD